MSSTINPIDGIRFQSMTTDSVESSAKILRQLYFLRIITITFIFLMIVLAVTVLKIDLPVVPLALILALAVEEEPMIGRVLACIQAPVGGSHCSGPSSTPLPQTKHPPGPVMVRHALPPLPEQVLPKNENELSL